MPGKTEKKKMSYGGCTVDHFSPAVQAGWPKAINIVLSFEEAMKPSLSLQHRLPASIAERTAGEAGHDPERFIDQAEPAILPVARCADQHELGVAALI